MQVSTNSWHYKYYRYICPTSNYGNSISLCSYVNSIILWSLLAIIAMPGLAILFTALIPLAFIVGFVPCKDSAFKPYDSPIIIKGMMIYPYHLITLLGIIVIEWATWALFLPIAIALHSVILLVVLVVLFVVKYDEAKENKNIIISWIDAKKSKVCPLIEFIDETKSTEDVSTNE